MAGELKSQRFAFSAMRIAFAIGFLVNLLIYLWRRTLWLGIIGLIFNVSAIVFATYAERLAKKSSHLSSSEVEIQADRD